MLYSEFEFLVELVVLFAVVFWRSLLEKDSSSRSSSGFTSCVSSSSSRSSLWVCMQLSNGLVGPGRRVSGSGERSRPAMPPRGGPLAPAK